MCRLTKRTVDGWEKNYDGLILKGPSSVLTLQIFMVINYELVTLETLVKTLTIKVAVI